MDVFLAVFFFIHGEPAIVDGWHPLEMPTSEHCEQRRDFMLGYLADAPRPADRYEVLCGTRSQIQKRIDILNDPAI